MRNRKVLKRVLIIIILMLMISLSMFRVAFGKSLHSTVTGIYIDKVYEELNGAMTEEEKKPILENLNEYVYLVYKIEAKNTSNKIRVTNINIHPIFSNEMKKNVIWFDGTDALTDSSMCIDPNRVKHYGRRIIVKRNGYSNDELINMAKKDKFEIDCYTLNGVDYFNFGHGKELIGYKK